MLQNAPVEHSAILLTCTKLQLVFKTFVLSIFEWPLKTGLTVYILLRAYNKGADQTADMHMLVCAFVCIQLNQVLNSNIFFV